MNNPYPFDNQYGQPAGSPNYPHQQPNPYNNPYPPVPPAPIYVLITITKQQSPTFVVIENSYNHQLACPFCGRQTQTAQMKKPGSVTYLWCCFLFWLTGFLCCIPFCVDSCLDTHLICLSCNNPKQVIPANCC
jgi:hypothetical protein